MSWTKKFVNKKNPKHRDYLTTAIVGAKRQGKTALLKHWIERYHKNYPKRPILIYDPSNAFGRDDRTKDNIFKGYDVITLEELNNGKKVKGGRKYWTSGIRRVLDQERDKEFHNELFIYMLEEFTDGLIVIDEATILFDYNPPKLHRSLVIKHTNRRNDMMLVFHRLKAVPNAFRGAIWDYIFFKTDEGYSSSHKIAGMDYPKPEAFFKVWKEVQDAPHFDDRIIQYHKLFKSK